MTAILLFLLFTVVPAVELWLLIEIGGVIGGAETVLYVIALGILGAWLGKRAGFSVMRQIAEDLRQGIPPADRLVEAALVLVGAVLLITPGVLTDATGLIFFVGPLRRFLAPRVKRALLGWLQRRGVTMGTLGPGPGFRPASPPEEGSVRQLDRKKFDHPVS